jgi:hypothetical protein
MLLSPETNVWFPLTLLSSPSTILLSPIKMLSYPRMKDELLEIDEEETIFLI